MPTPRAVTILVNALTLALSVRGALVYSDLHTLTVVVAGAPLDGGHTYRMTVKRAGDLGPALATLSSWTIDAAAGTLTGTLNLNVQALGTALGENPFLAVQIDLRDLTAASTLGIAHGVRIENPVHRSEDTPPSTVASHTYTDAEVDAAITAAVSGGASLQMTAGENLSAMRVVRPNSSGKAMYCDAETAADADTAVGITTAAALADAAVTIAASGPLTDSNWTWTPGLQIYLGAAGALTQTPPSAGFVQQVAVAETATRILINIQPAIRLA